MIVAVAAELNDEANCADRTRRGYIVEADAAAEFVIQSQTITHVTLNGPQRCATVLHQG